MAGSAVASLMSYGGIVREKAVLRELIRISTEIIGESYEAREPVDKLLDDAERLIFQISERRMRQTHPKLPLSFNYSSSFRWHKDANPLTFRELGELGYKFIFITLYGAHASMFAVWNAMQDLVKNEEQGQWALERTKVGHPTESHHVMARVALFQEFERKYIPGTEERLKGSDGFGEGKGH